MNIILFGPPGAGKGTQSALLVERNKLTHVSTGELFRKAVSSNSELGRKVASFLDSGNLVPDGLVVDLVEEVLSRMSGSGLVLDGFPRTVAQAESLEKLLLVKGISRVRAVFIDVPRSALVKRLSGRRVCGECGSVFHVEAKPESRKGLCDVCGGQLIQRKDDSENVVEARLDAYDRSTVPLRDYYSKRQILSEIDGTGTSESVYVRIMDVLENHK